LRNNVRNFVEKYFFDTPETATTVDISTFIEGGMMMDKKTKEGMKNLEVKATPEDLATEKRMSDNKGQHRTPKV
ncbi:hypothetical protein, partial [Saccharococcus caldoxylosilyticus]